MKVTIVWWLIWVLTGAIWLLVHFATAQVVWNARRLRWWERWMGMLPPMTPVLAWYARRKAWSILWLFAAGLYFAARWVHPDGA